MGMVLTLVRWDWFKLARRWMPWVVLGFLLLLSQLAVWGNYVQYRQLQQTGGSVTVGTGSSQRDINCSDVFAGRTGQLPPDTTPQVVSGLTAQCHQIAATIPERLQGFYNGFTLPGSVTSALGLAVTVALLLLAILTASVIGAEYGWGTLRPTLVRGTGRWPYLAAKLLLLCLVAGGMLLLVAGTTVVDSAIASHLVANPLGGAQPSWGQVLVLLGRSWLSLIPFIVLVACVTILTRSSASGMAIGIAYYLLEQIVVLVVGKNLGWFSTLRRYLLGENLAAWSGVTVLGKHIQISTLHAALVLLAYVLLLGGVAFAVFRARDIAGANAS